MQEKPKIGHEYNCKLHGIISSTYEGTCKAVNSSDKTAMVDFKGILFDIHWEDMEPAAPWRYEPAEKDPDECPKCHSSGEIHKTCCICRNCGFVLWGF